MAPAPRTNHQPRSPHAPQYQHDGDCLLRAGSPRPRALPRPPHTPRRPARDELAAARLRAAWTSLEAELRNDLTQSQIELLQAIGVLAPTDADEADATLVYRRTLQLDALGRLQQLVQQRIETLREAARP
jgi:hypothetical protein